VHKLFRLHQLHNQFGRVVCQIPGLGPDGLAFRLASKFPPIACLSDHIAHFDNFVLFVEDRDKHFRRQDIVGCLHQDSAIPTLDAVDDRWMETIG
jgi:hypothetical protein